jgi:hypothetical protein
VNSAMICGGVNFTGETLGDRILFNDTEMHSTLIRDAVSNYAVSAVIPAWDKTLSRSVLDPLFSGLRLLTQSSLGGTSEVRFNVDQFIDGTATVLTVSALEPALVTAYEAVRYVEATLGVPVQDVTKACEISRRTFYSWKKLQSGQPRLASVGRLWALVQTVEDLVDTLGGRVARWMREDPRRRELLTSGKFDELTAILTTERLRNHDDQTTSQDAPSSLPGDDISMPRMATRRVPTRARRARRVESRQARTGGSSSTSEQR